MYFRRAPARLPTRAPRHGPRGCASLLPVPLARQELIKLIRRNGDNALDALDALDEGPFKGISRTSVFASPVCYRYATARSQHLDAALALLGTARDSTEASTAERLTCAILAAHPSDSLTELTRRADTALEHDDLAAAQIELDAALALDATHADNYARRANVHVRNSKHRRALADAEKALALEPRHVGARSCLLLSASECL